jgi:hypothetical protein
MELYENLLHVNKCIFPLRASDFKQSATREDQVRNVGFVQKRVRDEWTQIEEKWLWEEWRSQKLKLNVVMEFFCSFYSKEMIVY